LSTIIYTKAALLNPALVTVEEAKLLDTAYSYALECRFNALTDLQNEYARKSFEERHLDGEREVINSDALFKNEQDIKKEIRKFARQVIGLVNNLIPSASNDFQKVRASNHLKFQIRRKGKRYFLHVKKMRSIELIDLL
jgi:hypothetical protein